MIATNEQAASQVCTGGKAIDPGDGIVETRVGLASEVEKLIEATERDDLLIWSVRE